MLAIKIEYLTGVCMATRHNDPSRSRPEWPPHPDRLFSALVAAAAEPTEATATRLIDGAIEAMNWLAKQGAPKLCASDAQFRTAPEVHMPSNPHEDEVWQKPKKGKPRSAQKSFNLKSLLPIHRKRSGLPIPAVIPDDPDVYFIWPQADANGHLESLQAICDRVTRLGRSRSLVRVTLVDHPPNATHLPDELGQIQLRVPGERRLKDLIENYRRKGGKPDPSPPQRYRRVDDDPRLPGTPSSVFERMYVFKPRSGAPVLPATSTLTLTQTFRRALIACIEQEQLEREQESQVPDVVHGHGKHPHCAYVALPFVDRWQRHADGTIKGVAVAIPKCDDNEILLAMALGLARLQTSGLRLPGIGTWHLEEHPPDDSTLRTLLPNTWTKPSRLWTTATPMVFGHFPKAKNGGEPKVILDSLELIGIQSEHVLEIAVGRHSSLHGSPPSWRFKTRRQRESAQPPRLIRHVTLRFDRPVRGPILLGCKRYFGLGLMRPLEDTDG